MCPMEKSSEEGTLLRNSKKFRMIELDVKRNALTARVGKKERGEY